MVGRHTRPPEDCSSRRGHDRAGIITAEALYTNPYNARMEMSDLGATETGVVLYPSSTIFNLTMLAAGAMILATAYFAHRALHRRAVTIPTGLLGVGVLGVGISRATSTPQHPLFTFAAFLAGGLAMLLSAKVTPQPLRAIFAVMGAVSLLFTVASVFLLEWARSPGSTWAGWSAGWSTRCCCGWSASAAIWRTPAGGGGFGVAACHGGRSPQRAQEPQHSPR